jgi:hypothetical protein
MPSHGITLGPSIIETSTFREDTDPAVVRALMNLNSVLIGAGFPAPAETGDTSYQLVYTREVTGADVLYGGKPSDPMNPDVLVISAAGSATVIWQEEGSTVATYGTVSFVGPLFTVTDGGSKAIVTSPSVTTKTIWGIDPDGGHTLTTSGTSLILTLKTTKYTFDAVNFASEVDADITITYSTGTECP